MDDRDMDRLTSELDGGSEVKLDLDNILNTFGGDYEKLARSIRERIYYRAATDVNREQLEESEFVTQLIEELDLPTGDSYSMGLHNSVELMIDSLVYQGLSRTLAEWFIFASMWDQRPYNYIKFIMDMWSSEWLRDQMLEHDYHEDMIIAPESLLQDDIFDRYLRGLYRGHVYGYEDEMVELLEWFNGEGYKFHDNWMEYSSIADVNEWRLNYVHQIYSQIRDHTTRRLALDILYALNDERSIDLFKLVYEVYND